MKLAAVWIAGLLAAAMTVAPHAAKATPQFTQQTGKACVFCHSKPPELNDQGKKFKANGNKL
jgi:cytochrome c553